MAAQLSSTIMLFSYFKQKVVIIQDAGEDAPLKEVIQAFETVKVADVLRATEGVYNFARYHV